MITVHLEPQNKTVEFERLNTVLQLLNKLGLSRTDALVIRGDKLLTPDRKIEREDVLIVRCVISGG